MLSSKILFDTRNHYQKHFIKKQILSSFTVSFQCCYTI